MRHSLLFSILQQIYEDHDEAVRVLVVKAISLLAALCDDVDKYDQSLEFSTKFICDDCDNVFQVTHYILYPILAEWGLHNGMFENIFNQLVNSLHTHSKNNNEIVLKIFKILNHLLPFMLVYVSNNDIICQQIEEDVIMDISKVAYFPLFITT